MRSEAFISLLSKVVFQSEIYIFCLLKYNFANLSLNNCSNCSECKNNESSAFRFWQENSSLQRLLHTKICNIFSNKFSRGEQVKWLFLKESSGSCKTDFSCRKTSSLENWSMREGKNDANFKAKEVVWYFIMALGVAFWCHFKNWYNAF